MTHPGTLDVDREDMAAHAEFPVLHIWPKTEQNLSLDPTCVAALLYLQLAIPNQFELDYTANPDLSPSGRSVLFQ